MHRLGIKARRGSKPRCHWLTHGEREQVAARLTELAKPWGTVSADDCWRPEGFDQIEEASLDKSSQLLPKRRDRDALRNWWLAVSRHNAMTPNWDIASTCNVKGTKGFLLVEAKAHTNELSTHDKCGSKNPKNLQQIGLAITQANSKFQLVTGKHWALSRDHHYQMSNRFAWSWKLTDLGYPVILVYLGFLNAEEMRDQGNPFAYHAEWETFIKNYSRQLFPNEIWDTLWTVNSRAFIPCIRSLKMSYDTPIEDDLSNRQQRTGPRPAGQEEDSRLSEKPLFKQCPNCQQFTPEKDSVCMHCEHQFAPPEVPQKKKGRTCGIWVIGVLAVLGLVFMAAVISFAFSEASSTSATRTDLSARETADRRTAVAVHTDTPRPATNTPTPLAEPTAISTPTVSRFTVTGNVVNVRRGPGTTFEIISTVNQGMQFDIIGKNQTGDWYQFCCVNDEQGWIFGELVEIENSLVADITSVPLTATVLSTTTSMPLAEMRLFPFHPSIATVFPTATSVPPTATPVPRPRFTVRGAVINVRQGPGTNYPVIGQLNKGNRFIIRAKNLEDDWYRFCCIKQKSGWIYAPLVDVENPQSITLIMVIPTPPPPPPTAVPIRLIRLICR